MNTHNDENGRVILLVLVTVFALSAFWFVALTSTGRELQWVGGSKSDAQQLFDAEAAINLVTEDLYNSTSVLYNSTPLYNSFVLVYPKDKSNRVLAEVTVRPIQAISAVPGLPLQDHEFTPPAGSGCGVGTCKALRYGITAVSGEKKVQVGVFRLVTRAN